MNDVMEFVAKIPVEYADYIKEAADGEQIVQIISRRADGTLKKYGSIILENTPSNAKEQMLQQLTADKLMTGMGAILQAQTLAGAAMWLNVGLGIANLAVTATGFKMISDKLNGISDKMDEVSGILKKVEKLVVEKNIVESYRKLVSETKEIINELQYEKIVSKERQHALLKEYRLYLEMLYPIRKELGMEKFLGIYYELLPMFANMIQIYYETCYDQINGSEDVLHSEWMNVFRQSSSETFLNELQDYYFLNLRAHNAVVAQVIGGQKKLTKEMINNIEDTLVLMQNVTDTKAYHNLMKKVNATVMEEAEKEMKTEIQKYLSLEETDKIINLANLQMAGKAC